MKESVKKWLGLLFFVGVMFGLVPRAMAYTCGQSYNQYPLTSTNNEVGFNFHPGYEGDHAIEIDTTYPYNLIYIGWYDVDTPGTVTWFVVDQWYDGYFDLYAGDEDIAFKIRITMPSHPGPITVYWRYCLD